MNTTSHLRRKSKALQVSMTPPMPSRARTSSESSFDESYFSKTYVPLSSLPTPPLSSHSNVSSRLQCPDVLFSAGEVLDPELLGKIFPQIAPPAAEFRLIRDVISRPGNPPHKSHTIVNLFNKRLCSSRPRNSHASQPPPRDNCPHSLHPRFSERSLCSTMAERLSSDGTISTPSLWIYR